MNPLALTKSRGPLVTVTRSHFPNQSKQKVNNVAARVSSSTVGTNIANILGIPFLFITDLLHGSEGNPTTSSDQSNTVFVRGYLSNL